MALFLARKRRPLPGPAEPLWKVLQGEDPMYVSYISMSVPICHRLSDKTSPLQTDAIERFTNETLRVYGVLEIHLSGKYTGQPRDYLAGNGRGKYSVADIGTWPWVKIWKWSGITDEQIAAFPHLLKWIDRIAERPAVKRGTSEKYAKE